MSQLHTRQQTLAGEYNFANDPGLGAIGIVDLQVHLPVKCLVLGFWACALSVPTSGGAATLSFGQRSTDFLLPFTNPVAFMVATPIAGFLLQIPIRGVDLDATPIKNFQLSNNVVMAIAGAPLTGGRIQFWIKYQENDL